MLRSYHVLDYGWTPLSQNPCWIAVLSSLPRYQMSTHRCALGYIQDHNIVLDSVPKTFSITSSNIGWDESFVYDLNRTRYCTCESGLCATIHWDSAFVLQICLTKFPSLPLLVLWGFFSVFSSVFSFFFLFFLCLFCVGADGGVDFGMIMGTARWLSLAFFWVSSRYRLIREAS